MAGEPVMIPVDVVPDPDDPGCADVWVEVSLAGRTVRFILDTGARASQVVVDGSTDGWARAADPPAAASTAVPGATVLATGHRDPAPLLVPELSFGPLVLADLPVTGIDAGAPAARNLLGLDVLGRFALDLDLDAGILTLGGRPPRALSPLDVGPHGHAYLDVQLGAPTGPASPPGAVPGPPQVPASAVWDTGAGITIVDEAFLARHPVHFTETEPSVGTDASGARATTRTYLLTGARVGGLLLAPHRVAAVDLGPVNATLARPMDLVLGYPTIRQARWFMDLPGRRWALRPTSLTRS